MRARSSLVMLAALAPLGATHAQDRPEPRPQPDPKPDTSALPEVLVIGRREHEIGVSHAASEGRVDGERVQERPLARPGEVVETVPGLVVTQHSGSGKANQFFLRGFNLDHGTDFATKLDGIPLNLPTHGHGQGYTDLNFLIPELVEGVEYRKGPYFAREGDFASAGSADLHYRTHLPGAFFSIEGGSFGYARALSANSVRLDGGGDLLYALELLHSDGPWKNPDDYQKQNGVVRLSQGDAREGSVFTLLGYRGTWNSTDQIAGRAVRSGALGRFDALDPSDGGDSQRFLLGGEWHTTRGRQRDELSVWAGYYDLELFSNFTYFLDDPVNGDQFLQRDQRVMAGVDASRSIDGELFGVPAETSFGVQVRNDVIDNGLFHTREREILSTTRQDGIVQTSAGAWAQSEVHLTDQFRATAGLRGDLFRFDVDSDDADNSGVETDAIASPKLSFAYAPVENTELYLSGGLGFHSNDGRGVLTRDDPSTPAPDDGQPVDALVRTKGAEVGVRTRALPGLESTLSLWVLESDSEILFVGDAGTTEPSRPTERTGVEWTNLYRPGASWLFDLDASLSHARFTDDDPSGTHVPGAVESVIGAGATWTSEDGWYASLRWRFFGSRPLIEDDSERSGSSSIVNAGLGYAPTRQLRFDLELLNLLDAQVDDIAYFYTSRLPGEAAGGVDDVHFHPAEPFALRVGLTWSF